MGNWRHLLLKFCKWNICQFFLGPRIELLNSAWSLFNDAQGIFMGAILTVDRPSRSSTVFRKPFCCGTCKMLKYLLTSCENMLSLCLLRVKLYASASMVHTQVIQAVGTDAPPYHHRCWLFHHSQSGWPISSLAPIITSWIVDLSDHRTQIHCLSVHLTWNQAQRRRRQFCTDRFRMPFWIGWWTVLDWIPEFIQNIRYCSWTKP